MIVIDIYSTAGPVSESLVSESGTIAWWSNDYGRGIDHGVRAVGGWTTIPSSYWEDGIHPYDLDRIKWRWRSLGFGYGEDLLPDYKMIYRYIPYWSIVMPLTLISIWSFLSKPQKQIQHHSKVNSQLGYNQR